MILMKMQSIRDLLDTQLAESSLVDSDYIISSQDVAGAISIVNAHKYDGNLGLSSDHFLHGGTDRHAHIAFLLTSIVIHGSVPRDFLSSTVIPIPKKSNINLT